MSRLTEFDPSIQFKKVEAFYIPMSVAMVDSERKRLNEIELDIARRQAVVQQKRERLRDDAAAVLQAEASLVQLQQENDSTERLLNTKEIQLEERQLALERKEQELIGCEYKVQDDIRESSDSHTALTFELEEKRRALEEAVRIAEDQHATEMGRLRKLQRELDDRDALVRDRHRDVTEKEQALFSKERRIATRKLILHDLEENALDRLIAELKEREALIANVD